MSYNLLIIDPQNDFMEGGNLGVTGAREDMKRIISLINKDPNIKQIFVSLDTHTPDHIGHQGFWDKYKKPAEVEGAPVPEEEPVKNYTTFKVINENGKNIITDLDDKFTYLPKKKEYTEYAIEYIRSFQNQNESSETFKGKPLIWPTHCLEGSEGHHIFEPLEKILRTKFNTEYYIKGQNELVEMYSIFQGEFSTDEFMYSGKMGETCRGVSTEELLKCSDPIGKVDYKKLFVNDRKPYLNTRFNDNGLFNSLTKFGRPIYICGEALSHCVNWSLRDLVNKLIKSNNKYYTTEDQKLIPNKIFLIRNASSGIPEYDKNVSNLEQFCQDKGVSMIDITDGSIPSSKKIEWGANHIPMIRLGGRRRTKKNRYKKRSISRKRRSSRRSARK
jgi:nicotinamidase-related amidase